MARPLFSIITATYNCGSTLDIACASLRLQARDDIEYIVVDGGSTDDTIASIERNRDVISKYISEPDGGIYDALNKGIKLATGKYIGILGADDSYAHGALDTVARVAVLMSADIIAGQTRLVSTNGEWQLRVDEEFGPGSLVSGIPFGHNAMFATADAYERIGDYDTSYRITADAQWAHRAIEAKLACVYIDAVLVHFAMSGASTVQSDLIMQETARTIRENFSALSNQEALTLLYCVRGWKPFQELLPLLARHHDGRLHQSLDAALSTRHDKPLKITDIYPAALAPRSGALTLQTTVRVGDLYRARSEDMAPRKRSAAATTGEVRTPFFSIVIPAYNAALFIHICLDSILSQVFSDYEIIVVDDGSTDDTPQVLADYQSRDPRIVVHRQVNARQGAARTAGLKLARGRYVWCIDSDDYIQSSILAKYHATVQAKNPDVIVLNFAYVDPDGSLRYSERTPGALCSRLLHPRISEEVFNAVSAWSCPPWRYVIRRDLLALNDIKFPAGIFYEDHPFAIELMLKAETVYVDPSVGYFYVQRAGSTMSVHDSRVMDFLVIRRLCLTLLRDAGLLFDYAETCSKYIVPHDFVRFHVGPANLQPFLAGLGDDMSEVEVGLVRTYGSAPQRGLLSVILDLRLDGLLSESAASSALALPAEHFAVHEVVHGLKAASLWPKEGPYPELGLADAFQWMASDELALRPIMECSVASRFVLRYRNIVPHQKLSISCNGKVVHTEVLPVGDVQLQHALAMELGSTADPVRIIKLMLSGTDSSGSRRLGLLVEQIALLDLAADQAATHAVQCEERLIVGRGSTADGVNLDIRVNPERRNYVRIGSESQISGYFVFERGLGTVTIGDRSSIGGGALIVCSQSEGIHIGNQVMLSWDVTLMDSDAHSLDPEVRANDAFDWHAGVQAGRQGCFKDWASVRSAPIRIHDNAWIGFGSAVLKGVTIGKGAVVGSKSVVSRSIPAYTVFAGNPARFVRFVPRAAWTFDEFVTAAQADPGFQEALEGEYLGHDVIEQYKTLLNSAILSAARAKLGVAGILAPRRVLQLGPMSGIFGCAFALYGYFVTCVDSLAHDEASPAQRLVRRLSIDDPHLHDRISFVASLDDALVGRKYSLIYSRHFLRHVDAPADTLRRLAEGLEPDGYLVAERDWLPPGGKGGALLELMQPYLEANTVEFTEALSWLGDAGLVHDENVGTSEWFAFAKANAALEQGAPFPRADPALR